MNKLAIMGMLIGSLGGATLLSEVPNSMNTRQISLLNQNKILDINFDTNEIKDTVNNKVYNSATGTGKLVNSIKGKGFETNSDYIRIPSSDLNIPTTEEYVTVTAQFKNGGTDIEQMLYAFGQYDIWIQEGWVGFNTSHADMYGVPIDLSTTEYTNITAVFHKSDISKCKLYINGIKQELIFRGGNEQIIRENPFSQDFYISSWGNPKDPYLADGKNIVDEVKVFKGNITDEQADKLAMAHRIPELSVRQEGLYAQANWATEILESDTIYNYDFEEGGFIPSFNGGANILGDITGGQKKTTETAYSGNQSIYTPKTIGGLGNHYGFPATQSNTNIMFFNRHYFPNGTKLSASFRTKDVEGENRISAHGDGDWADSVYTINAVYTQSYPAGINKVTIDKLDGLTLGSYITSDTSVKYGTEYCRQIRNIQENEDGTYTLTLHDSFVYPVNKGDKVTVRPWRGAFNFGGKNHSSKEWQLHNLNTTVNNNADYDVDKRGGSFYINTVNQGLSYLDDLKFGYATKVKLYRDNNLIYEGYESQLNDTNATDKVKPIMTDISINSKYEGDNRNITLSFPTVKDMGTTYNYNIKSVGRSGKETFLSENKSITVTSGLKGYSYVIDKNPNTVPGNTVNLSADTTKINHNVPKTDTGAYYLHIKPIDNQGNVGDVKHILIDNPTLVASAKPLEDMIRLDWTMENKDNKTFKVYQKKEGSNEFQSISATNLDKTKQVRVLNVYPTPTSNYPIEDINFTTWDGETMTLPKSASLKKMDGRS